MRHIVIKQSKPKDQEKILKTTTEKQIATYKGSPVRLPADFATEIWEGRRQWIQIFKVLKERNDQLRILYPAKVSFTSDGEIKAFSDKQNLREFVMIRPVL